MERGGVIAARERFRLFEHLYFTYSAVAIGRVTSGPRAGLTCSDEGEHRSKRLVSYIHIKIHEVLFLLVVMNIHLSFSTCRLAASPPEVART